MSESSEKTKLETMFYHTRENKHVAFLNTNELYAWYRTINTVKGDYNEPNGK